MKVSTRKITREKMMAARTMAVKVINELHPNTRLAFYCEKFLELNQKVFKSHDKKVRSLTGELTLELDCYKASQCVEKDGKLQRDAKGDYEYSATGEQNVLKKMVEIQDKIDVVVEGLVDEEVLLKCVITEVVLPIETTHELRSKLNGFAFKNANEHAEDVEETEEETTTA